MASFPVVASWQKTESVHRTRASTPDIWDGAGVEPLQPMRPVEHVEQPVDATRRREWLWWPVFFGALLIVQMLAVFVWDIGYLWAVLASLVAVAAFQTWLYVASKRDR